MLYCIVFSGNEKAALIGGTHMISEELKSLLVSSSSQVHSGLGL